MRIFFSLLVLAFVSGSAYSQDTIVVKNVLATPGPNFFYVSPSLAVNERNRSTQVIWEKHPGNHPDHETFARKIGARGGVKGGIRALIQGTNTYDPTVLYNKNKNEFAIFYADEFQNPVHTIFVQRLNAKGQIKGAPVKVSADTGSAFVNQRASATFDPVSKRYVIVWQHNTTTLGFQPGEGLMVAVLNEDLVTVAGPVLLREENPNLPVNAVVRDLIVLPSGRVLVAFAEATDASLERSHYYIASFDLDLTGMNTRRVTKKAVAELFLDASFAALPSDLFLYFVDANKIRKRKIDATGRPVGAISRAFAAPLKSKPLVLPRFVATPKSTTPVQGLLVAVEDARQQFGNGTIWIQRINAAGKAIGPPETIDSGFISVTDLKIISLPSSTATEGKFALIYVNGSQITIPPQGEFSELIHLNLTVPLQ